MEHIVTTYLVLCTNTYNFLGCFTEKLRVIEVLTKKKEEKFKTFNTKHRCIKVFDWQSANIVLHLMVSSWPNFVLISLKAVLVYHKAQVLPSISMVF